MKWECKRCKYNFEVNGLEDVKAVREFLPIGLSAFNEPQCKVCGNHLELMKEEPNEVDPIEKLVDAAIEEVEYTNETEKTKSPEVRRQYLENAIRYIKEAKNLSDEVIKSLTTQRDLARQAPFYKCPRCNEVVGKE